MMHDENTYQLIDQYLAGELKGGDLSAFQERLNSDADFAELVENHQLVQELIKGQQLANVKSMMDVDFKEGKVQQNNAKKWWWFGGLLAIGVLFSVAVYNQNTKNINQIITPDKPHTLVLTSPEKSQNIEESSVVEKLDGSQKTTKAEEKSVSVKAVDSNIVEEQIVVTPVLSEPQVDIVKPLKTSVENVVENEIKPSKVEVICAIDARALVNVQPSCSDENTGSIVIQLQKVVNATKPYQFKIEDAYGKTIVQQNATFTALMSEYYNVTLIDANNCTQDLARDVFVDIEDCKKKETDSFNPNYGEVFELPSPKEDGAIITIYSKYGREVYQSTLSSNSQEVWDGKNKNGEPVEAGIYIYKISYKTLPQEVGEVLVY